MMIVNPHDIITLDFATDGIFFDGSERHIII